MASANTRLHSYWDDPYLKDVMERMAHSFELHEALSSQMRPLSKVEQQAAYDAACLEWQQPDMPNTLPVDKSLIKLFFERCQTMMESNPTTTKDRFLVTFACYAMCLGLHVELDSHPEKDWIIGEATRVGMERILSAPTHAHLLSGRPNLPAHLEKALFPDDIDALPPSDSDSLKKPGPFLVGRPFKYHDSQTDHPMTCLVHDCGTSHVMGNWFAVSCDEEETPLQISQKEMNEIWASRITDPQ